MPYGPEVPLEAFKNPSLWAGRDIPEGHCAMCNASKADFKYPGEWGVRFCSVGCFKNYYRPGSPIMTKMFRELDTVNLEFETLRESVEHWRVLYLNEQAKTTELEGVINNYLMNHNPEHLGIRKLELGVKDG